MRIEVLAIAFLVSVALVPTVAADDPSFSVPDPQPVTQDAHDTAHATAGDTLITYANNEDAALTGVDETASEAENGNVHVPSGNVNDARDNTLGWATRTHDRADSFADRSESWAVDEAQTKLAEADHAGNHTFETVQDTATGAVGVAQTTWSETCRDEVVNTTDPTYCSDGSLVGQTTGDVQSTADQAEGVVKNQAANAEESANTVTKSIQDFLCGGPCA